MRVWAYVTMLLGMLVLLDFAGLHSDPAGILSVFGFARDTVTYEVTFDPSLSAIFTYLFNNLTELALGILVGLGLAGIAIGTFAKGKLENFIILPIITTTLVLFISAIKDVVDMGLSGGSIPAWIGYVIVFIGVVISGGLIVSLYEHFRGTD